MRKGTVLIFFFALFFLQAPAFSYEDDFVYDPQRNGGSLMSDDYDRDLFSRGFMPPSSYRSPREADFDAYAKGSSQTMSKNRNGSFSSRQRNEASSSFHGNPNMSYEINGQK